ncbi:MAG: methyltransferase domain-containing protein [Candidatus Anammoximicrobium sp.]|nr:methyltransferase domain-containing protein [Candidatus Anammoximicrobium sp.]
MRKRITEYSTFFREFRRTFDTTGALAPSGPFLARALARPLREHVGGPMRILEVGPGTGAVTQEIVRHIRPNDCLHIVELNDRFVALLKRRFDAEPRFRRVAAQTSIFHAPVQELKVEAPYDYIVCGLPFNNFPPELVESIFRHLIGMLQPSGCMTFFEYLWVRPFKKLVASREQRQRVVEVGGVLRRYLAQYERAQDRVFLNVLPAVAHYLRHESCGNGNGNGNGNARLRHDAAEH